VEKGKSAKSAHGVSINLSLETFESSTNNMHKLLELSLSEVEDKFLSKLEQTNLYSNIKSVLNSTLRIMNLVEQGHLCIVISKTFERCSQLTSLVQLLLDPYFRTIEGFEILIEKEFCSFAQGFAERIKKQQLFPHIIEFFDCVYQIILQFPTFFEFNHLFLVEILDNIYFGLYGTFLHDSEQHRINSKLDSTTISLWSFLSNENISRSLRNPSYDSNTTKTIYPNTNLRNFQFFHYYYCRPPILLY